MKKLIIGIAILIALIKCSPNKHLPNENEVESYAEKYVDYRSKWLKQFNFTKNVYFLIGKESKILNYSERKSSLGNWLYKTYEFKTRILSDVPWEVCIIFPNEHYTLPFSIDTIIKNRAFLDSITYYDERWLTEDDDIMKPLGTQWDTRYYVIDTTKIRKDSLMIIPVIIDINVID